MTPAPRPSRVPHATNTAGADERDLPDPPKAPVALSTPRALLTRIAARLIHLDVFDTRPDILDETLRQIAIEVRDIADTLPRTAHPQGDPDAR